MDADVAIARRPAAETEFRKQPFDAARRRSASQAGRATAPHWLELALPTLTGHPTDSIEGREPVIGDCVCGGCTCAASRRMSFIDAAACYGVPSRQCVLSFNSTFTAALSSPRFFGKLWPRDAAAQSADRPTRTTHPSEAHGVLVQSCTRSRRPVRQRCRTAAFAPSSCARGAWR